MSTLTGQQIKDTYDGLLKLANSTTGITSSLQAIQDGLGNDTGMRIATNKFFAPTVISFDGSQKPDYAGLGLFPSGSSPLANTNNRLLYEVFYDTGIWSYSAMSIYVATASNTDTVNLYLYTTQQVPSYGIAPKDLIFSGNVNVTSTGIKTITFPSDLSFSGSGGGYYCFAIYISNSGITQSVVLGEGYLQDPNQSFAYLLGFYANTTLAAGNFYIGSKFIDVNGQKLLMINNLSPQISYSQVDISNNLTFSQMKVLGFVLHTSR